MSDKKSENFSVISKEEKKKQLREVAKMYMKNMRDYLVPKKDENNNTNERKLNDGKSASKDRELVVRITDPQNENQKIVTVKTNLSIDDLILIIDKNILFMSQLNNSVMPMLKNLKNVATGLLPTLLELNAELIAAQKENENNLNKILELKKEYLEFRAKWDIDESEVN